MKMRDTQRALITFLRTLVTKVNNVATVPAIAMDATSDAVSVYPRAGMAADLFLLRALSKTIQSRLAEEARVTERTFRFSSGDSILPCPGRRGIELSSR